MPQKVEIQVTANTRQAETSIKRVSQGFQKATPSVKGFQGAFSGLTKTMGLFGLGGIGVGVGLTKLSTASQAAAKSSAQLAP